MGEDRAELHCQRCGAGMGPHGGDLCAECVGDDERDYERDEEEQAARSRGMDAESLAAKTAEHTARGLVPGRLVRRLDGAAEATPGPWYVLQVRDFGVILTDTRILPGGDLHTVETGSALVEPMSADEGASG